jgi:hypothetical protein
MGSFFGDLWKGVKSAIPTAAGYLIGGPGGALVGGALSGAMGGGGGGGGGGGYNLGAAGYTSPFLSEYDQQIKDLLTAGKIPAGIPTPEPYTYAGKGVGPGAFKPLSFATPGFRGPAAFNANELSSMVNRAGAGYDALQAAPIGYTPDEMTAMQDTLKQQLLQAGGDMMRQINASMANRGLRGGTMTNAQLLGARDIEDTARQGYRDLVLGGAEARRKDLRDVQALRNDLLGIGMSGAGQLGGMRTDYAMEGARLGEGARQFDAGLAANTAQYNTDLWNRAASANAGLQNTRFNDALNALLGVYNSASGQAANAGRLGLAAEQMAQQQASDQWGRNTDIASGLFGLADRFGLFDRWKPKSGGSSGGGGGGSSW